MTHPCTETFSQGTTVKYLTLEVNVTAVNNCIQKTIGMIAIKYSPVHFYKMKTNRPKCSQFHCTKPYPNCTAVPYIGQRVPLGKKVQR